jgi:hypothetical protein
MLRFSARSAFALAVALSVTACSNPVGLASPEGHPSASNSGKKCETTDAARTGALNMIRGVGMDLAMERDAPQGNEGMSHAVAVSGCW